MGFLVLGFIALTGTLLATHHPCDIVNQTWTQLNDFKVDATIYTPLTRIKGDFSPGTVIILPPTGGSTPLDRYFAKDLCVRDQTVIIVQHWSGLEDDSVDLDVHNRVFERAHRAVGMALEHTKGEVKLMGTSLGGLYGLSALSRYPQIRRAVLIVAGFPFTNVITSSEYASLKNLRDVRTRNLHLRDHADYEQRLSSIFKWNDPTIRSPDLDRVSMLLIQGEEDTTVPTPTQNALATLLPKAQILRATSGHFGTILESYFVYRHEVIAHLTEPGLP